MSNKSGRFISLHNHTQIGSPLDGMNDVDELFIRAKEIDHPAVAITDHGTMTAIYDAWNASKKTGVKLIPGIEAYFSVDLTLKSSNHLILLAKNEVGYRNLLRLNYESYKNQVSGYMGKATPRISWEHLESYHEGVIALTACSSGLIAKTLITHQDEKLALKYIRRMQSIFKSDFFFELQPHNLKAQVRSGEVNQQKLNENLIRLSHDMNIPYVITCDAHYKDSEQAKYHDIMLAIKDKKPINDPDRFRYGVQDMYLKTHEEIIDFFGEDIASIGMSNSIKISDMCENPQYIEPTGPILPRFPIEEESDYKVFNSWHKKSCPDVEEDKSYLRFKCIEGFKEKLKERDLKTKKEYWERVKKELSVLESKNFSSYMLIVADYTNWAKEQGIPCGPARGSAAGSLVAYLSGITNIDPIEFGLMFERFHNSEKESFPDIDSDFANPALIKDYLKEKYGEDKVSSISNWSTLSPKVIIKDVARSLLIGGTKSSAFGIANKITSIMPDAKTIEEACELSKEFDTYMKAYPDLYEVACKLQGLTRNWGVHAAGVVLSDRPLYEIIPLRIDRKTGLVVSQWEKTRCEGFGLVKMDLLGLKTLKVIEQIFRLVKETKSISLSISDIPLDDSSTFEMIGKGETSGVFQLESSLTPLCIKIKPKDISAISDINALGRPSCSPEQRNTYIKRKLGLEKVKFRHQNLEGALKGTYGVSLYEEGMMAIASDCAGWDLNQADALRKITKLKGKNPELVLKTKSSFIKGCMEHSKIPYKKAQEIWTHEIEPFGSYGFNRSHSISYSHISYYTAWLRCHYPVEFMCAILNSQDSNSNEALEYIHECKRMGISILPPHINNSGGKYTVTGDMEMTSGLTAIKGVGQKAVEEIISLQPFKSIEDFFYRTNGRTINKRVIQAMAKSGAFRCFNRTRKDLFDNYSKYRTKVNSEKKKEKTIDQIILPAYNLEWERKELLLAEREALGRTISGSLHEVFPGFFTSRPNITPLRKLKTCEVGDRVKVEVILSSKLKEFKIKRGRNIGKKFAKYLIEDSDGATSELTVWQKEYERYNSILVDGLPIKVICKVDEYMEQKGLSLIYLESVLGRE